MGFDIEAIRGYNNQLKAMKDEESRLKMEMTYKTDELNRICAELTEILGIPVTTENVGQVYSEQIAKISEAVRNGSEIFARIAAEEQAQNQRT